MPDVAVPNWTVAAAIAAPVTLVATSSVATMLSASHYDPVGQTLSVLAATPRSAPLMTIGFVLTAVCQIVTATGLHVLRPAPRLVLAFAGGCGLAVAAMPVSWQAAVGAHLFAAGAGIVTLSMWPVLTMSGSVAAPAACRFRWAVTASVLFAALVAWVLWETQRGGDLGIAERATVVGETLWPLVVAATARWPSHRDGRDAQPLTRVN